MKGEIRAAQPRGQDFSAFSQNYSKVESLSCAGHNRHCRQNNFVRFTVQSRESIIQFQQVAVGEFKRVLIGLILRATGIVFERRPRLFDVSTKNVGNRFIPGKVDQTLIAGNEGWKVRHVQPPRIDTIPCKQDSSRSIV